MKLNVGESLLSFFIGIFLFCTVSLGTLLLPISIFSNFTAMMTPQELFITIKTFPIETLLIVFIGGGGLGYIIRRTIF